MVRGVATVAEPAGRIARGDAVESVPGASTQVVIGARFLSAECLLDLGERLLDRIEAWRIGREMTHFGSARFDGGAYARRVMGGSCPPQRPVLVGARMYQTWP